MGGRTIVHTCFFDLDSVCRGQIPVFEELLDEFERARARRFVFETHRHRYIVSHARTRQAIGKWLGARPNQLVLGFGHHKKPHLIAGPSVGGCTFSLSRSGSLALLVFGECKLLGADLEQIRPLKNATSLAASFLFEEELDLVDSNDATSLLSAWTLKEAVLKATGEGLRRPFSSVRLGAVPPNAPWLLRCDGYDPALWRLSPLHLHSDYVASLAVETAGANFDVVIEPFRL